MKHLNLGAINKMTKLYEYPTIASKKNIYECPDCQKDVIFKKGNINRPHFCHYKSDSPCNRYDKPNESQIHKDAKDIIFNLLDTKTPLRIQNKCLKCKTQCSKNIKYSNTSKPILEYAFEFNGTQKIADVVLIDGENLTFIIEICNTHKTKETDRPEPWYEIDATNLITNMNEGMSYNSKGRMLIKCMREIKCGICHNKDEGIRLKQIENHNKNLEKKQNIMDNFIKNDTEQHEPFKETKLKPFLSMNLEYFKHYGDTYNIEATMTDNELINIGWTKEIINSFKMFKNGE